MAPKESLYGKAESPKKKKVQTKIKFKAENADEKLPAAKKKKETVKGDGYGLDLISEKEFSPPKNREAQKVEIFGQIGVKLFGIKNEDLVSFQPHTPMKLARQRSLSPEKHPTFLGKQEEVAKEVFAESMSSSRKAQERLPRVSNPGKVTSTTSPTVVKEHGRARPVSGDSGPAALQQKPNITEPISNSSSSDALLVSPLPDPLLASTSNHNAPQSVPSNKPSHPTVPRATPPKPTATKLKETFGPADIKRLEGSNSTTKQDQPPRPSYAQHKSNPNARAAMQDANFRQARTSASENFIEGYYQNSRLHYLSTWKSEMKNIVAEAHERAQQMVPLRKSQPSAAQAEKADKPKTWDLFNKGKKMERERYYMHCDFDSFFVAVGLLDRPALKGKPVVVCHSQGETGGASSTSEIASASYEARAFGIKNGMR